MLRRIVLPLMVPGLITIFVFNFIEFWGNFFVPFVLLDTPHGTKETGGIALAGATAAPLAGRVISRIAPLLGVAPRRRCLRPATQHRSRQPCQ